MYLGILQCDSVLPQFQEEHSDYPEMIGALLSSQNAGVRFTTFDVVNDEFPGDIDDCEGYVITGSKASVYDRSPWIRPLEDYIRRLHNARKPLVGICFGHQLIAQALGGVTAKAAQGWGVGVHTYAIGQVQAWQIPAAKSLSLLASHQDQVLQLPQGAELIAASAFCPHAMYQVEGHILALQAHPEFTKSYAEAMLRHRRTKLGDHLYAEGIASLKLPINDGVAAQWLTNFLRSAIQNYRQG